METMVVGEIVKAQGIKGEVKVRSLTDDATRFKKLKIIYIKEKGYKIESVRLSGDVVFLKFVGIDDRNSAEKLVGKKVEIDRINAVPLDDGTYFIVDLKGCVVLDTDGKEHGTITEIYQYGAADVIEVRGNEKTFSFPFLNRVIDRVDTDNKKFVVKTKEFLEVCVFDDD